MQNNPKRAAGGDYGFPQFTAFNFDALIEMQKPALTAMVEFNSKFVEGMTSFNEEWVGFMNRRLKEDLSVCKDLAECSTAQEVYSVCGSFYETTMKHYQSEADRMSRIGKSIADDTIHSVQDSIEDIGRKRKAA